ncbi:MAG: NAD(P)H-dependent oxidoreductase [Candidatus Dojkabacteria bacterium]|nr:NAD(P)H-dependent oxidoreductase [Candidatus Dojkabacteria bacterium]
MKILIIVSATRPNNKGSLVAYFLKNILSDIRKNIHIEIINPNQFQIKFDGDKDPTYAEKVRSADKIVMIVSEYNRGYPGKFKSLLDSEYEIYDGKKLLLVGVSSGKVGGARGLHSLLPVVHELRFDIFRKMLLFSDSYEMFLDENTVNCTEDFVLEIRNTIDEFLKY